jgi:hypothetical protein
MATKPHVVVDPYFSADGGDLAPSDLARLHALVEVVWGRDDPMPLDQARDALTTADAIVCSVWRYGEALDQACALRAILGVSGAFPANLDYDTILRAAHPGALGRASLRTPGG